jgi:predicted metal-dependent phosphoesterase TrpH
MLKLDLHIHSQYSEDGEGTPKEIIKVLQKKGLNGMAITDHNSIKGSLTALKESSRDFIVIPGVEISTNDGHLLALNIKEEIPRNLSVEETVEKIIDIGGTPIVPHLLRSMSGIKEEKLKIIKDKIPAIEVLNACSVPQSNLKVAKIAKKYDLGGTGGSDSHIPNYVGFAYTVFDTTDLSIDNLLDEINKKKTWAGGTTLPINYRKDRMVKSIKQFAQRGFKRI